MGSFFVYMALNVFLADLFLGQFYFLFFYMGVT